MTEEITDAMSVSRRGPEFIYINTSVKFTLGTVWEWIYIDVQSLSRKNPAIVNTMRTVCVILM